MSKDEPTDWEAALRDPKFQPDPTSEDSKWMNLVAYVTGDGSYFSFHCDDLDGLLKLVERHSRADALEAAALECEVNAREQRRLALECQPVETVVYSAYLLAERAFEVGAEAIRKLKPEAG